jgi:type II secretory pathway pseudopilin PulG
MLRRRVGVLVVLLIVGVTAALILGGIERLRQSAKAMSCSNNLRQLGMAVHGW